MGWRGAGARRRAAPSRAAADHDARALKKKRPNPSKYPSASKHAPEPAPEPSTLQRRAEPSRAIDARLRSRAEHGAEPSMEPGGGGPPPPLMKKEKGAVAVKPRPGDNRSKPQCRRRRH